MKHILFITNVAVLVVKVLVLELFWVLMRDESLCHHCGIVHVPFSFHSSEASMLLILGDGECFSLPVSTVLFGADVRACMCAPCKV